jgi:flavin-dependent dehydrogenase
VAGRYLSADPSFVVLGAGPAGIAAAIGLAGGGARVLLLERAASPLFKPGEILEPTIRYPLRELGLLEGFEGLGSLPLAGNLSLWGNEEPTETVALLNPHGAGYLVDRARLEDWLARQAVAVGVELVRGARRITIDRDLDRCQVAWEQGGRRREAAPALLIDATGRNAGQRRWLDNLVALLAYSDDPADLDRDQRLYIEAAEHGWWYSAPLPNGQTVIAFMTDADLVPVSAPRRLALFREQLAQSRLTRLRPRARAIASVRSYPAASTVRDRLCGAGWVAIGDAAASYDPLSGRGVAAAMAKGAALARLLLSSATVELAVRGYVQAESAAQADYVREWRAIYAREARLRTSRFWQRRLGQAG